MACNTKLSVLTECFCKNIFRWVLDWKAWTLNLVRKMEPVVLGRVFISWAFLVPAGFALPVRGLLSWTVELVCTVCSLPLDWPSSYQCLDPRQRRFGRVPLSQWAQRSQRSAKVAYWSLFNLSLSLSLCFDQRVCKIDDAGGFTR